MRLALRRCFPKLTSYQVERALGAARSEWLGKEYAAVDGDRRSSAVVYARYRVVRTTSRWAGYRNLFVIPLECSTVRSLICWRDSARGYWTFLARDLQLLPSQIRQGSAVGGSDDCDRIRFDILLSPHDARAKGPPRSAHRRLQPPSFHSRFSRSPVRLPHYASSISSPHPPSARQTTKADHSRRMLERSRLGWNFGDESVSQHKVTRSGAHHDLAL